MKFLQPDPNTIV